MYYLEHHYTTAAHSPISSAHFSLTSFLSHAELPLQSVCSPPTLPQSFSPFYLDTPTLCARSAAGPRTHTAALCPRLV